MPTKFECSYLEQGYRLPEELTWDMAAQRRTCRPIDGVFIPVAVTPRSVGWNVPTLTACRFSIPDVDERPTSSGSW